LIVLQLSSLAFSNFLDPNLEGGGRADGEGWDGRWGWWAWMMGSMGGFGGSKLRGATP